jgi:hypothetical protein
LFREQVAHYLVPFLEPYNDATDLSNGFAGRKNGMGAS